MQSKRPKVIQRVLIILVISGIVLSYPSLLFFKQFLAKTKKVNANVLLVEGWLPRYALKMAAKEFEEGGYEYILTSGLELPEYLEMFSNGFLVYQLEKAIPVSNDSLDIEVEAFGSPGGKYKAHFNVWINDSIIADFYAGTRKVHFSKNIEMKVSEIQSIMIEFDNDGMSKAGDINLFFKTLRINGKEYLPYSENNYYDHGLLDGKHSRKTNSRSYAESARQTLLEFGLDSSKVIAVPGNKTSLNRTLASSEAVFNWYKNHELNIEGANLVSLGVHSRRSWQTYHTLFKKEFPVGVIALPDYKHPFPRSYTIKYIIKQTLAYFYYLVVLLFA